MKFPATLLLTALCLIAGLTHAGTFVPELETDRPAAVLEHAAELAVEAELEADRASEADQLATTTCQPDLDALDHALQPTFQVAMFDECLIHCYTTFLACRQSCGSNGACLNACADELETCRNRC